MPTTSPRRVLPDAVRPWLGAVIISFSAMWVRLAEVEPARSAMLRAWYALPLLALLVALQRRRDGVTPWITLPALGAGLLLGIDLVAWHTSIGIIGSGLATVLVNLQVVVVGLAGVVLFGESPRRGFWFALPIVLSGTWLLSVVGESLDVGGSVPLGVAYALVGAVTYAAALVVLRVVRGRSAVGSGVHLLWSLTIGVAIVTTPVAAAQDAAGPAGWPADGWLLMLAIGSQVIGWLLLTSSIHRLPAAATSIALLLQPVLALVWGRALLAEPIGALQVVGAVAVLLGVAVAHRAVTQPGPAVESAVYETEHV